MSNARKVGHFDREVEAVLAGTRNKRAEWIEALRFRLGSANSVASRSESRTALVSHDEHDGPERDGSDDEAGISPGRGRSVSQRYAGASMRYCRLRPGLVTRRPGVDGRAVWHLPLAPPSVGGCGSRGHGGGPRATGARKVGRAERPALVAHGSPTRSAWRLRTTGYRSGMPPHLVYPECATTSACRRAQPARSATHV